jgi:hypothetical protein
MFSTLKIMDFEIVALTKKCSYLCDRGHEWMHNIYDIKSNFS